MPEFAASKASCDSSLLYSLHAERLARRGMPEQGIAQTDPYEERVLLVLDLDGTLLDTDAVATRSQRGSRRALCVRWLPVQLAAL